MNILDPIIRQLEIAEAATAYWAERQQKLQKYIEQGMELGLMGEAQFPVADGTAPPPAPLFTTTVQTAAAPAAPTTIINNAPAPAEVKEPAPVSPVMEPKTRPAAGGPPRPHPRVTRGKVPADHGKPKLTDTGRIAPQKGRSVAAETLLPHIPDEWCTQGDLAKATGRSKPSLTVSLRKLIQSGQVEAKGERAARRYRKAKTASAPIPQPKRAEKVPSLPPRKDRHVTRIKVPQIRAMIVDALRVEAYSEEEMATLLDMDREDIAFACGQMLEEDVVKLRPDGKYEGIKSDTLAA